MTDVAGPDALTRPTPTERSPLVLGPLLRRVGETTASVWVETARAATVTVRAAGQSWSVRTFGVERCHYALVLVDGLDPGSAPTYTVEVDDEPVWPLPDSAFPPSRLRTLEPGAPTRIAFGSCRTSAPHDRAGNARHGIDALRATGLDLARQEDALWPQLLALLGDQVYADETSPQMQAFIAARRSLDEPPWAELKDYTEYAHLYHLAWTDPAVRWLLSTLPSLMVFDDHDIRDDWNTSVSWHREVRATSWWHERIVGGLASYWVYQHVGNLSPEDLAEDALWQRVAGQDRTGEVDLTAELFAMAGAVDADPTTYRWSYAAELGRTRLVVVDSRAARVLTPEARSILDDQEMQWLQGQLRGDVDHLLIGTSLPFLLEPGLHDFEALNEALAEGTWGPVVADLAERTRRAVDLEHWAAFQHGFVEVFDAVIAVARGERGRAPGTITFLSGDVHHSYVAEVTDPRSHGAASRIVQAVCSPIRNPLPRHARVATALLTRVLKRPMHLLATTIDVVPPVRYPWTVTDGPWYDNCLAVLETDGRDLRILWSAGTTGFAGNVDRPSTRVVASHVFAALSTLEASATPVPGGVDAAATRPS